MTTRFFSLQRLVARLVRRRRRQVGLRTTISACALATIMAGHAAAQTGGGAAYPPEVVGSFSDAPTVPYGGEVPVGNAVVQESGVMVGPGGATSATELPSVLGPATAGPAAGPLVNQPFPSGPFIQSQPTYGGQASVSDMCDGGCDLRWYGSAEALYWRRENDERFGLSQGTRLQPFDYDWAGRVTIGRMLDCVNGYEISYVGPFQWDRQSSRTGTGLQSKLNADSPYTAADISAFNNATLHQQAYRARMNSLEFNKRCWAWDVFSTLIGVRVVDYREDYIFRSINPVIGTGYYQDEARNIMVGPQIGGDWMQPFGLRTLVGFKGKAAALANFNRNQVFMSNGGLVKVDSYDDTLDIAGLFELGTYVKYSITPSIRVQAGYDLWYMPGVATVPGQGLNHVNPDTGIKSRSDEELFIQGGSFGAQILF